MISKSLEFRLTMPNQHIYLDPLLPEIGDCLNKIDITVLRCSSHYNDEVIGVAELINGDYKIAVNVVDLTPGLYQFQSIVRLGDYIYYREKSSYRVPRWL